MRTAVSGMLASAITFLTLIGSAFCQNTPPAPPVQPLAPPAAPVGSDLELQFTPRFWYFFSTGGGTPNSVPNTVSKLNEYEYPMGGATVSVRSAQLPSTTFLLTGLYGTSNQRTNQACVGLSSCSQLGLGTNLAATANTSLAAGRLDLEFLAQTTIPETNWAWILGARLERTTLSGIESGQGFSQLGAPIAGRQRIDFTAYVPTAKFGLAYAVPLSPTGDIQAFANGMMVAGFATDTTKNAEVTGLFGPDMSVGVQYALSSSVNFDARYRALVLFTPGHPAGGDAYAINQGPLIGLTVKF